MSKNDTVVQAERHVAFYEAFSSLPLDVAFEIWLGVVREYAIPRFVSLQTFYDAYANQVGPEERAWVEMVIQDRLRIIE